MTESADARTPGGSSAPQHLGRAVLSAAAWLGAINSLAGLAVFALLAYLNRALPDAKAELAIWFAASQVHLFSTLLFEIGLSAAIMQRKDLSNDALAGLARLQVLFGIAGSLAIFLVAGPLAALLDAGSPERLAWLLRWISPIILLVVAGLPSKSLLQRHLRFREVAIVEGIAGFVFVGIAAALGPSLGIRGLLVALFARHGIETACFWARAGLPASALWRRIDWSSAWDGLRFGGSMAGQTLVASSVRQGDSLVVGALAGQAMALYRPIQGIVMLPFTKLLIYVTRAAFPTFARVQDDPERLARGLARTQRLTALATFPALAGLAAIAPRLLALYFGSQYAADLDDCITVMRLLCLGGAAATYAYSAGVVLNAAGIATPMLVRQAIGAAAVFGAMAIGAPWGFVGVSAGRSAGTLVIAVALLDLARRQMGFSFARLRESLREALPASLLTYLVVAGAGTLADTAWPASAAGGGSLPASPSAALAVLAGQVLLGVVTFFASARALGLDPRRELRDLRSAGAAAGS